MHKIPLPHVINGHVLTRKKSRVLIREFACARAVEARLLIMFATRHHAKHVLNYENLTAARILHSTRVGKCDQVIKYSASIFSSFSQCFVEFMQ